MASFANLIHIFQVIFLFVGLASAFHIQNTHFNSLQRATATRKYNEVNLHNPTEFSSLSGAGPLSCAAASEDSGSSPTPVPKAAAVDPAQIAVWGELMRRLVSPEEGTMAEAVDQYLDMCDYGFLNYLNEKLALAEAAGSEEAEKLRDVLVEINQAMQKRLVAADERLRQILSAGELKTMEAMTKDMVRNNGVDMPFMVILNMNIAQAKEANAEQAEHVLQHLYTVIQEEQDKTLPSNVRLLRLLLRTTCSGVREDMMKQKLIIEGVDIPKEERMWGQAEVEPKALFAAMEDVLEQTAGFDQELDTGVAEKIISLREEVNEFLSKISE